MRHAQGIYLNMEPKLNPAFTPEINRTGNDTFFVPLAASELPMAVFRANDIRGFAEAEITPQFARQLARAFALEAKKHSQTTICLCRDGRLSSDSLRDALALGLTESGCQVFDLGTGPTPLLGQHIATHAEHSAGIMITASHNPKNYNGFKIILDGNSYSGAMLQNLRHLMAACSFEAGSGNLKEIDASLSYLDHLQTDIADLSGLKLAIDAANGAAGPLSSLAFERLGCSIEQLYCEIDGNFPNHGPDPCQSNNLKALCDKVVETGCDFGIALDGDGDRIVAVDNLGGIVTPDQLYQLFARDLLHRTPGATFVFDVKASRQVALQILDQGGIALMEKSGRTFIQDRVKRSGALLGGEYSSHYFFQDRWNAIDDGIYAACRLAEIVRSADRTLNEILTEFPSLPATEELEIGVLDEYKTEIFDKFRQNAKFPGAELIEIDGLRIEYPQSWGLVRVSNTGPKLSVRFEGENEEALAEIQDKVRHEFERLCPELNLPF